MYVEIPHGVFSEAVRHFWKTRAKQAEDQGDESHRDQGERSSVTGGKQMDGFAKVITDLLITSGVPEDGIYWKRNLELPGFFRPTKEWDLLVVVKGNLLASLELKSQVGPSFGNNFNNRTEEAIGTAVDMWTAYREGAIGKSVRPWAGYLFVLEDCPRSQGPVKVHEPHFKVFKEYLGASYARRYEILCRKLIRERHYDGSCLILTDRKNADQRDNYVEVAEDLSVVRFFSQLFAHIAAALHEMGMAH